MRERMADGVWWSLSHRSTERPTEIPSSARRDYVTRACIHSRTHEMNEFVSARETRETHIVVCCMMCSTVFKYIFIR